VLDGAPKEVGPVPAFQIEDFTPAGGWEEMGSGLLVRVLRPGEGDRAKGIFDRRGPTLPPLIFSSWSPIAAGSSRRQAVKTAVWLITLVR